MLCVVFCAASKNNPVFLSVTISHILKNKNYELCFLAGSFVDQIDRNCDVLPLLKFCTNKPILASLLRQFFFGGGKGGLSPKKRV